MKDEENTVTMTLDQMESILKRAYMLPHGKASDVFMTAAMIAETVENVSAAQEDTNGKRKHVKPMLTVKRLKELDLDYPTVADCAWDLVSVKKMTHAAAAKRMGATVMQVNAGILNYRRTHGLKSDKAQMNHAK
jgi:hypothetical protein